MWYEILYRVLSIINYVVLIIVGIPLLWQVICIILGMILPKKKWARSNEKGKIAFLIPAYNEQDVIYDTVKDLIDKLNYPRELFDVFVVADNCTDETARLAREAGATVFERSDDDPMHRAALYPLKFGVDKILEIGGYDMVIHLDADNHVNADFALCMNDAFQAGVDLAKPYEGAINATQNFYTKACTIFYMFDSRYGSRVRERLHLAAHVNGAGAMMSVRMLEKCGGYDSVTISDDTEFYLNRLAEGTKGHFVEEAIVYEDMPASARDTLNRNKRIGSGGANLLKSKILGMPFKFFKTGDFSYIEIFLNFIFLFISVMLWWLPAFYIYDFLFTAFAAFGFLELTMYSKEYFESVLWGTLIVLGSVLLGLFVFFGWLQTLFLAVVDYKVIGAKNRRELTSAVFLFPIFLIYYAITVSIGTMSKPKWTKLSRSSASAAEIGEESVGGPRDGPACEQSPNFMKLPDDDDSDAGDGLGDCEQPASADDGEEEDER